MFSVHATRAGLSIGRPVGTVLAWLVGSALQSRPTRSAAAANPEPHEQSRAPEPRSGLAKWLASPARPGDAERSSAKSNLQKGIDMRHSDTASGMVHKPELGEYCFTFDIHVDCRKCQKDATIGSINGDTVFNCKHCGWSERPPIKYDTLLDGIKLRSIKF